MTETSSRLLELLSLLQGRRDWPGDELASRLEVSGRTVRRDVERLRRLGYPVESLTGPAGGYRLLAGSAMPPLLLDDDEAIAIAVGLRTGARAAVTRSGEAAGGGAGVVDRDRGDGGASAREARAGPAGAPPATRSRPRISDRHAAVLRSDR